MCSNTKIYITQTGFVEMEDRPSHYQPDILKQLLKCIHNKDLNVATITERINKSFKNRLLKQK